MKALLIVLGVILLVIVVVFATIAYLRATSEPTFNVKQLQQIVNEAVTDYRALPIPSQDDQLRQAKAYFDEEIFQEGQITDEKLVEAYYVEKMLDFVQKRFIEAFPGKILKDAKWAYQNTGGIYARQKVLMCNLEEYLCIWGTPLAQSGFSGAYGTHGPNNAKGFLNEGDVMVCGLVESADPESKLAAPRTYTFGNTSFLKPGRRRHYTMTNNTYMISFALHGSNMIKTFWPGIVAPYLFVNQDVKSAKIMIGDAMRSTMMWIKNRRNGRKHHHHDHQAGGSRPESAQSAPVQGCNCTEEDQKFLNDNADKFREAWKTAGVKCMGNPQCALNFLHDEFPQLSKKCLHCFAKFIQCSAKHCMFQCMFDSNSESCKNCASENCKNELVKCDGGFA